jgi:hypothetical protein
LVGLRGPEYLAWLADAPEADDIVLMGATTYRLMSGFATQPQPSEEDALDELAAASKIVFSSTLEPPLTWQASEDSVFVTANSASGATPTTGASNSALGS